MLIVNGRVFGAPAGVTAIAIEGERILAVGSDREIHQRRRSEPQVIDARGGLVAPGFNDAHVHLHNGSRQLVNLDLGGESSVQAIVRRIAGFAQANPDREWICGRGWIYATFPGGYPNRSLLDRVVPDRPAAFESFDVHTTWINSAALARLGITRQTPDPPGGHIMRDEHGEPTGILKETAMELVDNALPALSVSDELDLLKRSMELAASYGLTSVQDASAPALPFSIVERLRGQGYPTLRVRLSRSMKPGRSIAEWEKQLREYEEEASAHRGNRWIAAGILKTFMDGVIETRTASMFAPYEGAPLDQPGAGQLQWDPGEFEAALQVADRRGWQVQVHAIGDRAIRCALDAFEAVARNNGPRGRRHRIEHIEAISPADLPRFGQLGVVASMQPYHADPSESQFESWAKQIGAARAAAGWPWGSIHRMGGRLAFGSDWPVVSIDPRLGLNMAVNRTTVKGQPAGGWIPSERLSMAEAIDAYTSGAAYAEFAENEKGQLRPGMLADITIFERDVLSIPGNQIMNAQVQTTIVGGNIVFRRGA